MWRRNDNYKKDWERRILRSYFGDVTRLTPVNESAEYRTSWDIPSPTRRPVRLRPVRAESPLPDLIIERIPKRNRHDESEEFYQKLQVTVQNYINRLKRQSSLGSKNTDLSSTFIVNANNDDLRPSLLESSYERSADEANNLVDFDDHRNEIDDLDGEEDNPGDDELSLEEQEDVSGSGGATESRMSSNEQEESIESHYEVTEVQIETDVHAENDLIHDVTTQQRASNKEEVDSDKKELSPVLQQRERILTEDNQETAHEDLDKTHSEEGSSQQDEPEEMRATSNRSCGSFLLTAENAEPGKTMSDIADVADKSFIGETETMKLHHSVSSGAVESRMSCKDQEESIESHYEFKEVQIEADVHAENDLIHDVTTQQRASNQEEVDSDKEELSPVLQQRERILTEVNQETAHEDVDKTHLESKPSENTAENLEADVADKAFIGETESITLESRISSNDQEESIESHYEFKEVQIEADVHAENDLIHDVTTQQRASNQEEIDSDKEELSPILQQRKMLLTEVNKETTHEEVVKTHSEAKPCENTAENSEASSQQDEPDEMRATSNGCCGSFLLTVENVESGKTVCDVADKAFIGETESMTFTPETPPIRFSTPYYSESINSSQNETNDRTKSSNCLILSPILPTPPKRRRNEGHQDVGVQTSSFEPTLCWDMLKSNFFVGIPEMYKLCKCSDHRCN